MSTTIKYAIQIATSSGSLIASSTIASMILTSPNRLSSPYRRLIFGLSVSDVVQSLAILTGPFAPPKGAVFNPWAMGNTVTCNINGFMATNAFSFVPMYTTSLCIYYVCKLTRRMSDEVFATRVEWILHVGIFLFNCTLTTTALALDSYNPSTSGFCYYMKYPMGCDDEIHSQVVGQCTRGLYKDIYLIIGGLGGPFVCLFVIICCGAILCHHALKKSRQFRTVLDGITNPRIRQRLENQEELSRLYRREVFAQASLYIICYLIVYFVPCIALILSLTGNRAALTGVQTIPVLLVSIFPLGGFFNIVIFCRPKVNALRRRETDMSWIVALVRVIRAGGEIPLGNVNICCCFPSADDHREDSRNSHAVTESNNINSNTDNDRDISHEPESNVGMNGLSDTFQDDNIAYRTSGEWNHIKGCSDITRLVESLPYIPDKECILDIMYAREINATSYDPENMSSLGNVSDVSISEDLEESPNKDINE